MNINLKKESLKEIKLVGISILTSNLIESNPESAKIPGMFNRYFSEGISSKISNQINPERIFSVYTKYESDKSGNYTYFLGQEVDNFENNESLEMLSIPAQNYIKFTNHEPLPLPSIVIDMWNEIWKREDNGELIEKRSYIADFEIYDQRSNDHQKAIVDIFVGIL
jgi:predicted transcriptional regulator YdeE